MTHTVRPCSLSVSRPSVAPSLGCRLRPIMACCWSRLQMHAGISPVVFCWVECAIQSVPTASCKKAASKQASKVMLTYGLVLGTAPIGLECMWLRLFRHAYPGLRILCVTFRAPHPAVRPAGSSTSLVHVRGPKIEDPAWVGSIPGGNLGHRARVRLEAMAVYSMTGASSGRLQQSNARRQLASRGRKSEVQLPTEWCALPMLYHHRSIAAATESPQVDGQVPAAPGDSIPNIDLGATQRTSSIYDPSLRAGWSWRRLSAGGPVDGPWPGGVRERCCPACPDGSSERSAVDPCCLASCSSHDDLRREGSVCRGPQGLIHAVLVRHVQPGESMREGFILVPLKVTSE